MAVAPLPVEVAVSLGELAPAVGAVGAVAEARGHGAQLATRDPVTVAKVLPPDWGVLQV